MATVGALLVLTISIRYQQISAAVSEQPLTLSEKHFDTAQNARDEQPQQSKATDEVAKKSAKPLELILVASSTTVDDLKPLMT